MAEVNVNIIRLQFSFDCKGCLILIILITVMSSLITMWTLFNGIMSTHLCAHQSALYTYVSVFYVSECICIYFSSRMHDYMHTVCVFVCGSGGALTVPWLRLTGSSGTRAK